MNHIRCAKYLCFECNCAFTIDLMRLQHAGGCAAMFCQSCKVHYCLWCRAIVKALGKERSADSNTHDHVFGCGKKPDKSTIITESVLVPFNKGDEDFVDCYFMTLKLRYLAQTVAANWTEADCKRLVLNSEFQAFLQHLRERQVSEL